MLSEIIFSSISSSIASNPPEIYFNNLRAIPKASYSSTIIANFCEASNTLGCVMNKLHHYYFRNKLINPAFLAFGILTEDEYFRKIISRNKHIYMAHDLFVFCGNKSSLYGGLHL